MLLPFVVLGYFNRCSLPGALFATGPILYRRSLPAIDASALFRSLLSAVSMMPCSIPVDRAGPAVLDIPILSEQTSADSTIGELRTSPPLLRLLRLLGVLSRPLPMGLTEASPLDSRDFPASDANPSLSSLSVPGLVLLPDMNPIALGTSLRPRMLKDGSAFPDTGMRIGSPPFHLKNPREALNKTGVVSWYETTGEL